MNYSVYEVCCLIYSTVDLASDTVKHGTSNVCNLNADTQFCRPNCRQLKPLAEIGLGKPPEVSRCLTISCKPHSPGGGFRVIESRRFFFYVFTGAHIHPQHKCATHLEI